jgi:uncharacterized protein involved in exopolysaccharide biosynthesis
MRQFCVALSRQRWKAALTFVLVLAGSVTAVFLLPRRYASEARLFVHVGRESVSLDPTATTGQTLSMNDSRESEMSSVVDLLASRSLRERVVEVVGVAAIIPSATDPDDALTRADSVRQLDRWIEVSSTKNSGVVGVSSQAPSAELAQQIVEAFVEAFRDLHLRVHRIEGSQDFFTAQEQPLRARLEKATQELREAKNAAGVSSIEGRSGLLQQQLAEAETEIRRTASQLATAEARVGIIQKLLDKVPQMAPADETTGLPNEAGDRMQEQLYVLRLREAELDSRYTDDHPDVVAIRRQVRDAQAIADQQPPRRTQSRQASHPAQQKLLVDLWTERALVDGLKAQSAALQRQRDDVLASLRTANEQDLRLIALQRQVDLLDSSYRKHRDNLEQVRIDHELQAQRISNVNVAQKATFDPRPVSPKRGMLSLLAGVLAVSAAVWVALLADYLDGSLKSAEDVEGLLDLPVLMSVPQQDRWSTTPAGPAKTAAR